MEFAVLVGYSIIFRPKSSSGLKKKLDHHGKKEQRAKSLQRWRGNNCRRGDRCPGKERHRVPWENPGRIAIVPEKGDKSAQQREEQKESFPRADKDRQTDQGQANRHHQASTQAV